MSGRESEESRTGCRVEWFSTPGPSSLARHGHDLVHLCLLLDGSMREADGAKTVELRRGEARVSPSGDEHRIRFGPAGGSCALLFLPDRFLASLSLEPPRERRFHIAGDRRPPLVAPAVLAARHPLTALTLQELAVDLLFRDAGSSGRKPHPRWLDVIRDLLHDAPEEVTDLGSLAIEAGVHPGHLTRTFRAHFGCSPSAYLRWRRMARAAQRVVGSDEPLVEVAHSCGFADQAHMTRWFRRFFGTTPGRARSFDVSSVQDGGRIRA